MKYEMSNTELAEAIDAAHLHYMASTPASKCEDMWGKHLEILLEIQRLRASHCTKD